MRDEEIEKKAFWKGFRFLALIWAVSIGTRAWDSFGEWWNGPPVQHKITLTGCRVRLEKGSSEFHPVVRVAGYNAQDRQEFLSISLPQDDIRFIPSAEETATWEEYWGPRNIKVYLNKTHYAQMMASLKSIGIGEP